jgi:hypothetical protein
VSRLKAASRKPAYDPNEPTDDNDQETPVEVENLIAISMSEYQRYLKEEKFAGEIVL